MNNSKYKHTSMVDMRRSGRDSLQCSLCRNNSAHTNLLTCPSGHIYCDLCNKHENKETNQIYKNVKFNESRTSTVSKSESTDASTAPFRYDLSSILKKHKKNEEPKPVSRPVSCPVQECAKVIARNNVLLHFCYDHAKIPRLYNLNTTTETRILHVKITEFIEKSRCYAVVLPTTNSNTFTNDNNQHTESSFILNNSYNNHSPLLLMGATFSKTVRNLTQTEGNNRTSSSKSVTVISEDKRIGHSYIGQAIHIKEPQDAFSIYDRAECLVILSGAINKIINEQCQLQIIINILD
ncbi:uncharacterized protein LOC105391850 isoform X2 [Plutella xylostella]|uniref:uncharacterized protein LOC105391850 isoform X2 n=1 Tax=Plutella xylostella TaxID=51655 RepID=UPI0020324C7B|nr:uncharacterized protein LOC105391850 isoform X2 [Plutella xylostella]